jgi:hypothetical protein
MYRRWFLGIGFALVVADIMLGQTAPTEAETLRSLLSEVRQLRQALQTTTVTAQRIQITLYRLQVQVLEVSQATQRLDAARSKVAEAERWRQHLTRQVEDMEKLQSQTEDQRERAAREVDLRRTKQELDFRTSEEQQLRTVESEALSQVQAAQSKLIELHDGLERLDKTLSSISTPPAN